MIKTKRLLSAIIMSAGTLMSSPLAFGQSGTDVSMGDWPDYNGNMAAQRYSPLDQINAENVNSLQIAWRLPTESYGTQPEFGATFTPLEVDGILLQHHRRTA